MNNKIRSNASSTDFLIKLENVHGKEAFSNDPSSFKLFDFPFSLPFDNDAYPIWTLNSTLVALLRKLRALKMFTYSSQQQQKGGGR